MEIIIQEKLKNKCGIIELWAIDAKNFLCGHLIALGYVENLLLKLSHSTFLISFLDYDLYPLEFSHTFDLVF